MNPSCFSKISAATLIAILATGCASIKQGPVQQEGSLPGPVRVAANEPVVDPVMASIAGSANQVAQHMKELKSVTTAAKMPNISPYQKQNMDNSLNSVPSGLGVRVSVQYSGTVDNFLRAVADSVGWKFSEQGPKPPVMPLVHKKYVETRAIDVLRDVGYSINGATVVIDSAGKTIILRYKI
ncbi:MAG TPA: DotD/TraH family lipoprotein [Ignavibacteriaceae bacterium]